MSHRNPEFLELTYDATLKCYWRINSLKRFLSNCGINLTFLAGNGEKETKREILDRTFAKLQKHKDGPDIFAKIANNLAEKTEFPDLQNWEDSNEKIQAAKVSVKKLKFFLKKYNDNKKNDEESARSRERVSKIRVQMTERRASLIKLEERFNQLSICLGQQKAGYEFQTWFFDLVDHFDIPFRRPYITEGRQIDGSITLDGTTYVIELKFTADQVSAPDIDSLFCKVQSKADNTMGVFVSISGFSSVALKEASRAKTVLLLLDFNHLIAVLRETITLPEVINRVRRHASQTGQAYLSIENFGG